MGSSSSKPSSLLPKSTYKNQYRGETQQKTHKKTQQKTQQEETQQETQQEETHQKTCTTVQSKKDEACRSGSEYRRTPVCKNADVDNISYFLAYELPRCQIYSNKKKPFKFTLNAISKGTIIGNGSFGYIFRIINNEKKYIIKITLGNNSDKDIHSDKDNHSDKEYKILTMLNNKFNTKNIFIKLYGYYKGLGSDSYKLFGNTECRGQIKQLIKCTGSKDNPQTDYNSYGIMEAAEGSLMDYLEKGIDKNIVNIVNIVNNFEPFLKNFCHAFKIKDPETKDIIFVHNDIKLENIVYFRNGQLKLIDFDAANFPKTQDPANPAKFSKPQNQAKSLETLGDKSFSTFFCKASGGTSLYIGALYMTDSWRNYFSKHVASPFYDIFCLCVSFLEVMFGMDWSISQVFTFSEMKLYIKEHMCEHLRSDRYYNLAQKFINIIVFIRDMYELMRRVQNGTKAIDIIKVNDKIVINNEITASNARSPSLSHRDTVLTKILRKMLNIGSLNDIEIDYRYDINKMRSGYEFSKGDYANYCFIIDSLLNGTVTKHRTTKMTK